MRAAFGSLSPLRSVRLPNAFPDLLGCVYHVLTHFVYNLTLDTLIAPTTVFVGILGVKNTAQTLVGAISDRQHLQQLSIKAIKDCIQAIQSLIFADFSANSAAR